MYYMIVNVYTREEKLLNIYDIAKECGVSTATVSRVINGGSVSEETRTKVKAVLDKTGYRPNPYAQGMNITAMKTVGILMSEIDDLYYMSAVASLENELRRAGYDIIIHSVGRNPKNIKKYIDQFVTRKVSAIFSIGSVFHSVEKQLSTSGAIPIITINLKTENDECYNIFCDDTLAVERAVKLLHQRGHRVFLYLYDADTVSEAAKLAGFRKGLASCGISESSGIIRNCPRNFTAAQNTAVQLLSERPDITAVLTSVDELAVGVARAASSIGRLIPGNLAIVGYDNSILAECATPRITSIDNRVKELCTLGAKLFFDLIDNKPVPRQQILNCRLVERETT